MDGIGSVAALGDPVRRRLYEYVVAQADAVGREQAAEGAEVPAHTARFHLDRLVDEGLLEVEHRRLSGRSGPGAGRPAKLYRRAGIEVAVSLPPRSYDLVARVLASAVERSLDGAPLAAALAVAAHEEGRSVAQRVTLTGDEVERTREVLAGQGFEPTPVDDGLVLRNCPFDALASTHTELVCGVNRDFVGGVVDGLGCRHARAELDPGEDRCCVRVRMSP